MEGLVGDALVDLDLRLLDHQEDQPLELVVHLLGGAFDLRHHHLVVDSVLLVGHQTVVELLVGRVFLLALVLRGVGLARHDGRGFEEHLLRRVQGAQLSFVVSGQPGVPMSSSCLRWPMSEFLMILLMVR